MKTCRTLVTVSALAVAGCGGAGNSATPSNSTATAIMGTAEAHGWHTTVTRTGPQFTVTVTAQGPLTVEGGCIPSLSGWLEDARGIQVVEPVQPPRPVCMALAYIDVPADTSRDFTTAIAVPTVPGTYTVHGLLLTKLPIGAGLRVRENIPVVTVRVGS